MNIDHVKILAWEHYRKSLNTVIPAALGFSALLISALLLDIYFIKTLNYRSNADELGIGFTMSSTVAVALMLLIANTSDKELKFSMGDYYLRLPIKSWHLAAIRITLNLLTLMMVFFVLGSISIFFYNLNSPEPTSWLEFFSHGKVVNSTISGILFTYLIIQVIAWTFSTPTVFVYSFLLWIFYARNLDWLISNNTFTIGLGIGYFVCIWLSGISLSYSRSDEPFPLTQTFNAGWQQFLAFISVKRKGDGDRFESKEEAQYWLELNSMLHVYKNITLIFLSLAITFGLFLFSTNRYVPDMNFILQNLFGVVLSALIISMIIMGICNGIATYRRQTSSLKDFMYTKPISTPQIARSRTKALLRILRTPSIIFLVFGLVYCICYVFHIKNLAVLHNPDFNFGEWSKIASNEALLVYGSILISIWYLSWIMHSISSILVLWCLVVLAASIGEFLKIYSYPLGVPTLGILISISPIIYTWRYSIKKNIVMFSPKFLWLLPIFYLVMIQIEGIPFQSQNELSLVVPIYIAFLVFLPFASVPATIHLTRHR